MNGPNQNKNLTVRVKGQEFNRYPVETHFIRTLDDIDNIISEYVDPISKEGDMVVLCQKIVSILQKRIIKKKDVKVGFFARYLSKLVTKTPAGFSVGNPYKMQVAIDLAGLPRILLAALLGGIGKIFRMRGVFYKIAGHQISQLDGFYGEAFSDYKEIGILGPKNCDRLCNHLSKKFKVSFVVADVNDLGGNILGISSDLKGREDLLLNILKDNPAGQFNQQTPIIIIRPV